jgi:two-component system cell cycle response regulator CpdR
LKLLLVDDHATFRSMAARTLAMLGHHVIDVPSAEEAKAVFHREKTPFDVVVVDVFLGDSDGRTLVEELETSAKDLRVLFITGDMQISDQLPEVQCPHRRFMLKPFLANEIEAALQALVRS